MGLLSSFSLVVVIFSAQIAAQIFTKNFEGSTSGCTIVPASGDLKIDDPNVSGHLQQN
jgi:hypothetical protein